MNTLKIFMLIYLVVFYATAFFWRSWRTWRETGINPYRLNHGDALHRLVGQWYRVITAGVAGSVLIYALVPAWYAYLAPIAWLEETAVRNTGIAILLFSLVWVLAAQAQMKNSWRIGIDTEHETTLVTGGIFRRSRNPIFIGMRVNLLGVFLILPNAVTLTLWILGDVLIQFQVLMEEAFLQKQHGPAYEQYCRQVRRWL
ncbi:MAG: isoprenylcysteine carboxylmethyltransferase family protein [Anaerolineales bacterium]|nr:isoprenylcysteine carboxylmethyltransferase family protein [Anaerolineales bacterium]